jgi:hypothetical protein
MNRYYDADGNPKLYRLDPEGCGCTDCLVGASKPYPQANQDELRACMNGELDNATDAYVVEEDDEVIVTRTPAIHRIDPADCGCVDCMVGYSRPLDEASAQELRDCSDGLLENASGAIIEGGTDD